MKIELAPDRTKNTWQNHYKQLQLHKYIAKALASDRGKGITGGFNAVHPQLPWYSDHFHEFRGLFKLFHKFEVQAYAAIEYEHDRLCKFNNESEESNLEKRQEQYEQASLDCLECIELYEQFEPALSLLIPSLYFINHEGKPNCKQTVNDDILAIMDWLEELENDQVNVQTKSIRSHIDDITSCYQQVEDIYQELSTQIASEPLNALCVAWQHQHLGNQASDASSKHYHQEELNFWVNCAEPYLGTQAEAIIKQVFDSLEEMVRSSSKIETVNSLIRPYLNSCKGQITQETLNLIMFFHNHRPYKSGKRKGSAPIEILTNTKLDKHWVESLSDAIALSNS